MGLFRKLDSANELATGMAVRLGVDLESGFETGPVQAAYQFRDMVMRCSTCTHHEECRRLQAHTIELDFPPAYCRNRDRFERG
ncbi:hypothetical protein KUV65_01165 [Maritalea mobilis]|uniref:DUF6455 family protein n=1 Tax=Maritalea mobilis TaxID=483324 RepID=UPI001C957A50|nr:DUF6455 family protein [Maritalea mobilis]MBY6199960.1 hypothetical protein [Maritalea mobilis]